jgi:hypothetical protein
VFETVARVVKILISAIEDSLTKTDIRISRHLAAVLIDEMSRAVDAAARFPQVIPFNDKIAK